MKREYKPSSSPDKQLFLRFHGRVLEHLGLQIYYKPVNAIAELVTNAWDADAEEVKITLPGQNSPDMKIDVADDGSGMTFDECQKRYLNVGWNRRGNDPNELSPKKSRPILGRKGIGKFAGFGIAELIRVDTISECNGEHTVFELDLEYLLGTEYMSEKKRTVRVVEYESPSVSRKQRHGTQVTLERLKIKRPRADFNVSMARRFLLHEQQDDFVVQVNGQPLPESFDFQRVQFVFPRDYNPKEKPSQIQDVEDGWGVEQLEPGKTIRWRFLFHKEPIDEEDLRGIAVFAKGKLAQTPFFFNLSGGLGGQHGLEYLSGQVVADFIDALPEDLIATERQRINWEHKETAPLLAWGQDRVKQLLRLWQERRGAENIRKLEKKVSGFVRRLEKLPNSEVHTVKQALMKLAQIPSINERQLHDVGHSLLTAWEQGRLRELIHRLSAGEPTEESLLGMLWEAEVLTALNIAEAVKTKIATIQNLKSFVENAALEDAVRGHIAQHPWLISAQWETYRRETSLGKLVRDAAKAAGLTEQTLKGRVDLVLSSGDQLLVLEFMRPGLTLDWDHVQRFRKYMQTIRTNLEANTAGPFRSATGYVVADALTNNSALLREIAEMKSQRMFALDWSTLLANAVASCKEFLEILASRKPDDERLRALLDW